jgi:Rrf2 family nitric oxide-sensitive transcriptional repressor
MFSQTVEYALRAVVYLAARGDTPQPAGRMAEGTRVPADYLAKVLQSLGRAGLVRARRGPQGGYVLARPADELSVLDVVEAVDPIRRIRSCPLGLEDHIRLCPLHKRMDQALDMVEKALRQSTIAELLGEPDRSRGVPLPLCNWPMESNST